VDGHFLVNRLYVSEVQSETAYARPTEQRPVLRKHGAAHFNDSIDGKGLVDKGVNVDPPEFGHDRIRVGFALFVNGRDQEPWVKAHGHEHAVKEKDILVETIAKDGVGVNVRGHDENGQGLVRRQPRLDFR
jgi:hypothetical protein